VSAIDAGERTVFLVGFMGAGKTSVGRALAELLGFSFIDLDDVIESGAGRKVSRIFAESGEAEFRRLETEALRACSELTRAVIALGGGAYISPENREIIRSQGRAVWLDCQFETCLSRIEGDQSRPMLRSREETLNLYRSRLAAYSLADHSVSSEGSVEEIAGRIARLIERA
jgi:shikimate kinase